MPSRSRFFRSVLLPSMGCLLLAIGRPHPVRAQEGPVIFLVRHAERADDTPGGAMSPAMAQDPALSPTGRERAELLARMLRDAGITSIHSTDYRRTRDTAGPLAAELGLDVEIYDGADLLALAETLSSTPGRHLVVGHSNTTPELVGLLGGDPGPPIQPLEYDRLYVLTFGGEGVRTLLLHFGTPFP